MIPHEPHRWKHPDAKPEELIIRLRPGYSFNHEAIQTLLEEHGATLERAVGEHAWLVSVLPENSEKLAKLLSDTFTAEYAYPNVQMYPSIIPNEAFFPSQFILSVDSYMQFPHAWNVVKGSASVAVAVMDADGIDSTIPDLAANLLSGWNTLTLDNNTSLTGGDHQTVCSSVIAAVTNNGSAMSSGGWNTPVVPIKLGGGLTAADSVIGINWVRTNKTAKIINMSYAGGGSLGQAFIDEVNAAFAANIVLVAAAGNNGSNAAHYPAAHDNVVGVSWVIPSTKKIAAASNYGSWCDVSAIGSEYCIQANGTFNTGGADSGTSIAAPVVCAVLALMFNANPGLSASEAVRIISSYDGCDPVASGTPTGGDPPLPAFALNAYKAVQACVTLPPFSRRMPKSNVIIHGSF